MRRLGAAVVSTETDLYVTSPGDGYVTPDCCEKWSQMYTTSTALPETLFRGEMSISGRLSGVPSSIQEDTTLGQWTYIASDASGTGPSAVVLVDDSGNEFLYGDNARLFDVSAIGGDTLYPEDANARFPLRQAPMQLARCGDLTGDGIEDLCTTDGVYAGPLSETPALTASVTTDAVAACPNATTSPGMFVKDGDAIHFVQTVDDLMNRDLASPLFTAPGELLDWVCAGDRVLALVDGSLVSFDQTTASSLATDYVAIERADTGDVIGLAASGRVDVFRADDPTNILRSVDTENGATTMALHDGDGDGTQELVIGYPEMEHDGMYWTSGALLTLYGW